MKKDLYTGRQLQATDSVALTQQNFYELLLT